MSTLPLPVKAFWEDTIARTRQEPLAATCEQLAIPEAFTTFRVTYQSFGGEKIVAMLGVPILEHAGQRLPAIISAPGYSGWGQGATLSECQRGYIIMQINPRDQGESSDRPRYERCPGEEYLLRGIRQPEGYYYQGAYMDLLRGVDYLLTRADVDPGRLGAMGTSQAGGMVLASSALDPRIKAVVAHVPFFCDLRHNPAFREHALTRPEHLDTFDTFDPLTLAPRLHAPTLLSSGGRDAICPAETIRAVAAALPGIKTLAHYPELTHTSSLSFYRLAWEWMERYL
jgi:cephalosporin-C deacetylase